MGNKLEMVIFTQGRINHSEFYNQGKLRRTCFAIKLFRSVGVPICTDEEVSPAILTDHASERPIGVRFAEKKIKE